MRLVSCAQAVLHHAVKRVAGLGATVAGGPALSSHCRPRMSNSQQAPVRRPPPSSPPDIERRVFEIVRERPDINRVEVTRDTRFHELGDSLTQVEIVMEIEDEFEVSIPDDEADNLKSVGQMIDFLAGVVRKRAAGQPEP